MVYTGNSKSTGCNGHESSNPSRGTRNNMEREFVIRYNKTLARIENIIEDQVIDSFAAYWENADDRYRIKKGPCLAVAIWLDYLYFILVKATDAETAVKIALDALE